MDFNNNGKLDVFDLLVMEHILSEENVEDEELETENEDKEEIEQKDEYIKKRSIKRYI